MLDFLAQKFPGEFPDQALIRQIPLGTTRLGTITSHRGRGPSRRSHAVPQPDLTFEGCQGTFDNFAESNAMREFSRLVAEAFTFNDLMKTVVGTLRDARIEKDGTAGLGCEDPL